MVRLSLTRRVSGDSHLLNFKTYQAIPIVAAPEALKRLPQPG